VLFYNTIAIVEIYIFLQLELNVDKTLFDIVFNQLTNINVLMKWLKEVDVQNYKNLWKQVISFYKMGSFTLYYYRYVEK